VAGFVFRLEHQDGRPADPPTFEAAVPDWRLGNTIHLGSRTLRMVAIRDDDADQPPTLVVLEARRRVQRLPLVWAPRRADELHHAGHSACDARRVERPLVDDPQLSALCGSDPFRDLGWARSGHRWRVPEPDAEARVSHLPDDVEQYYRPPLVNKPAERASRRRRTTA
jgi:hypothetical protein